MKTARKRIATNNVLSKIIILLSLAVFFGVGGCNNQDTTAASGPASSPSHTRDVPPNRQNSLALAINGQGTVTSADGAIDCPGVCTATYDSGSVVTLVATPGAGWFFSGWTGSASCSSTRFTVTVDTSCTAVFLTQQQIVDSAPFGFLDFPPDKLAYYSDLGTYWAAGGREGSDWSNVEKTRGLYDFSAMDAELCSLAANNINLIYVMRPINALYNTSWVEGDLAQTHEYPDGHVADYASFFKAWVEHYDGDGVNDASCAAPIRIRHYQLVHELEPVSSDYWMNHMDQYADVFAAMYAAMKEACADCVLYMPVPTLSNLNSSSNFMTTVLGYLQGKGITDIGFEYHTFSEDTTQQPAGYVTKGEDYADHGKYIDRITRLAQQYGFPSNNIISTESGMAGTQVMERDQAGYVVRMYVSSLSKGQKKLLWTTTLEYSHYDDTSIFAHIGLVHNPANAEGLSSKKLSYYTYKKMVEILGNSDWNSTVAVQQSGNINIYKFMKNGVPLYVAWWDYFNDPAYFSGNTKQVSITGITGTTGTITVAVPNGNAGSDVTDYATAFSESSSAIVNGTLSVPLGEYPVYIQVR
jgi:hypothetical protein